MHNFEGQTFMLGVTKCGIWIRCCRNAFFYLVILVSFTGIAPGQDTIRFKSGTALVADVVEVSPSEILYRNWKEDKPVYRKLLSEIDYIRYANGRLERFETAEPLAPSASVPTSVMWEEEAPIESMHPGRFFLGYNLMDIFFPLFTTAFEYIWPGDRIGLMLPVSIGITPWNFSVLSHSYILGYHPLFRLGVEPRFYAARGRRISYYVSPAAQYMRIHYLVDYTSNGSGLGTAIFDHSNLFRLMLYNGFTVVSRRRVAFGMDLGIGYQVAAPGRQTASLPLNRPAFQIRMFLGRRF